MGSEINFEKSAFRSKANEFDFLFKLLLIGESGVGKSALLLRFTDDHFSSPQVSTIGVDFKIRTIDVGSERIKLQIWDTAGQERFKTVTNAYFRGSHGIILVYDITSAASFEALDHWLTQAEAHAPSNCVRLLIGNKVDLVKEREVPEEEAREFAEEHGMHLLETSAKEVVNVHEAFFHIASQIKERIKGESTD